jgi:hypothetical protein
MPARRRRLPQKKAEVRNRNGAEGAVWRRIVQSVISRDFGICWICKHPGANSGDHVVPVAESPGLALAPSNIKAVHAYSRSDPGGCPVCSPAALARGGKPVYCNEIRGALSAERARRIIEERTGLKLPGTAKAAGGEREW